MSESEQWRTDGDCRKCRRANYCHTRCRANDRYNKRVIGQVIRERTSLGVMEHYLSVMRDPEYIGQEKDW